MSETIPADLFEDVKIVECTNEEYHGAWYDVASASRLKALHDDPYEFYCRYVTKELERKETPALVFGKIAHAVILEHQSAVQASNYSSNTVGVFRPCAVPARDPDIVHDDEELWIVSSPEGGIVRRASFWGDLDGGRHWRLVPDRNDEKATAMCAFADMHIDGVEFRNVPQAALSPAGRRQGKVWDAWSSEHDGENLMTPEEWSDVLWMRNRLRHHRDAYKRLFCGGNPEVSIVGRCASTGLQVQTRLDYVAKFANCIAITDLKTSRDSSPALWNRQAFGDRLHVQATIQIGLASHVWDLPIEYRFAVVDKAAPHRPETFDVGEAVLDLGIEDFRKDMATFERCLQTGRWYHEGHGEPNDMEVPASRMVKWA